MTLTRTGVRRHTSLVVSGGHTRLSPMQEELRAAIALLIPPKRREHRQGWQRKEILARRSKACGLLEQVLDEAIADGVRDVDVERVGLIVQDAIRQKIDGRRRRPLGVPSLGEAIEAAETIESEMAPLELQQSRTSTLGGVSRLRDLSIRQIPAVLNVIRACDAFLARIRA